MTTPELTEWVHVWHGRKKHLPAASHPAHLTMCGKHWVARWIKDDPHTEATPECRACLRKSGRYIDHEKGTE